MRAMRWSVVPLVAVALVAAGCGGGGGGAGTSTTSSTGGGGKGPITIGTSLPLTGQFSEPGKAAKQGYLVWQKMVNDNGGLMGRQVKLIIRDDASDQNTIVADYNALISRDKVDLLLGTFSALLNLPASTVAERNRMLFVEPAGGAPGLFTRGYKYLFFSQQATSNNQGNLFAQYILSLPPSQRPKTAAYPTLDDPFAGPVLDGIRAKLEPAGIKTVYRTTYPASTSNFDTIANAIKAAKPDLLVHGATFADGISFIRAIDKVGFKPKYFFETSAPSFAKQFSDGIGVKNTQGIFYAVSWDPQAKTPGNAMFLAQYRKMFGSQIPAEDAADAFATGQVLRAAIKGAGGIGDQTKMADWLRANSVSTILGPLRWQSNGAPNSQFLIGQWQNGTSEIVLPKKAATTSKVITTGTPFGP